jgi:hypothetical protein
MEQRLVSEFPIKVQGIKVREDVGASRRRRASVARRRWIDCRASRIGNSPVIVGNIGN